MFYDYHASPLGKLLLVGTSDALHFIGFPTGKGKIELDKTWIYDANLFKDIKKQLKDYFSGHLYQFNITLNESGTAFQLAVLDALKTIPYGQTRSYSQIAKQINRDKAIRAVGGANARNPLPIVIPCHRVIASDGKLTGFGGGIQAKKFLLELESKNFNP